MPVEVVEDAGDGGVAIEGRSGGTCARGARLRRDAPCARARSPWIAVLSLPSQVSIYACTSPVDFRKQHDGLVAIVRSELGCKRSRRFAVRLLQSPTGSDQAAAVGPQRFLAVLQAPRARHVREAALERLEEARDLACGAFDAARRNRVGKGQEARALRRCLSYQWTCERT